jgi:hypothetical protein
MTIYEKCIYISLSDSNKNKTRPDYNHLTWPSPIPKILVKRIYYQLNSIVPKRVTHQQALDILAKEFNCTVEEFLKKSKKEVYSRWFTRSTYYGTYVYDPFNRKSNDIY